MSCFDCIAHIAFYDGQNDDECACINESIAMSMKMLTKMRARKNSVLSLFSTQTYTFSNEMWVKLRKAFEQMITLHVIMCSAFICIYYHECLWACKIK